MAITLEQAKALQWHDVLVDGYGKRWRVNGKVKTWKRNPGRVAVPLKHGLYSYATLDETMLHRVGIEGKPDTMPEAYK